MTSHEDLPSLPCPTCGTQGDIHEIVYGMPAPGFDSETYQIGGCERIFDAPKWMCRSCGWEGLKKPRRPRATSTPSYAGLGKFYAARANAALKRDRANGYHWGYLKGEGKTICTCGLVFDPKAPGAQDHLIPPNPDLELAMIVRVRGHRNLPTLKGFTVALISSHGYGWRGQDQTGTAFCQSCREFIEEVGIGEAQRFVEQHNQSC